MVALQALLVSIEGIRLEVSFELVGRAARINFCVGQDEIISMGEERPHALKRLCPSHKICI
jgi:hypothetical protein